MYKFFKADLDDLVKKRDVLAFLVKEAGLSVGEAANQSSETWHDNAPYDIAKQDLEQFARQHSELDEIVKHAVIVPTTNISYDRVVMGTQVKYKNKLGEIRSIKIGSHIPSIESGAISCAAPTAHILMNNEVGNVVKGEIAGRAVEYEILEIAPWQ